MQFSVDGWDPTYGMSLEENADELIDSAAVVDAGVEISPEAWAPIGHDGTRRLGTTLFVDGVRRIDAHLWVQPDGEADALPGICASYAAGVACSRAGRAHVSALEVRRGLFTVDPHAVAIPSRYGDWPVTHSVADPARPTLQVLSQAIQRKLAELEVVCAAGARANLDPDDDDLLVIDGPLRGRTQLPRTIALVKSHQAAYLPQSLNRVVGQLGPEQRTPVFLLGTTWERFTWYLRLPGSGGSPWAGIVRIECAPELSADQATALANLSQATLPRYASEPFKDTRAPQNLYPIGGLERELRHRLGDANLLRRALQASARRTHTTVTEHLRTQR